MKTFVIMIIIYTLYKNTVYKNIFVYNILFLTKNNKGN